MVEEAASAKEAGLVVRALEDPAEMRIGVELQKLVWGFTDIDTVPDQMFIVARESGGQVLAAFRRDEPIGFALAFAGLHRGTPYLHSHMVAVVSQYRDCGVGRMLKLAQREHAIDRGIGLIEWTFDPLQLKNAHFNLMRLGAVVQRYIPNFYGRTSSPLHAGLPTDRLVAEWWIHSNRVKRMLSGALPIMNEDSARICIPASIRAICSDEPAEAEQIQSRVRREFDEHIADGLAAVGFELNEQRGNYVLEPYED
jgi:predicted GNAT superfamily acetyltransferase